MSIMQRVHSKNANSKKYRDIVSKIYSKFEDLYEIINFYALTDSLDYIKKAYKCFEKAVEEDLENHQ